MANVSTQQSAVLDATLTSMLGLPPGNAVDLTVADYQALADADISLSSITQALNAAGVGTDANGALNTNTSLNTALGALSVSAAANGNNAAAAALDKLKVQTASVNAKGITLNGLINADTRQGQLDTSKVNLLDTVNGLSSLFSTSNATPLREVTLTGSALGLNTTIANVTLALVVVQPAVQVCGPVGSQFYSAAVRVRARVALTGTGLNLNVPPLTSLRLDLNNIDLVAAVARSTGTITAINAIAQTLTVSVTPGVAELYLGTISDANFLDRTTPINPSTELTPTVIGNLSLALLTLTATATVSAQGYAVGGNATASTLNFTGPYEQTLTATTSSSSAATLVDTLLNNLTVNISAFTGNLGLVGNALNTLITNVTSAVTGALKSTASNGVLKAPLVNVTTGVIDPLLGQLGVSLGSVSVTAGAPHNSLGTACNDDQFCTLNDTCTAANVCVGTARTCDDSLTCTADACDEAADKCNNTLDSVSCLINGNCVGATQPDPGDNCRVCTPAASTSTYSVKATPECGVCVGCIVSGVCVPPAGVSPANDCQVCNPTANPNGFSNAAENTPCNDDLFCTATDRCNAAGACVGSGARCLSDGLECTSETCSETADSCSVTVTTGCLIAGNCYAEGAPSPGDRCRVCQSALADDNFTYVPSPPDCVIAEPDGGPGPQPDSGQGNDIIVPGDDGGTDSGVVRDAGVRIDATVPPVPGMDSGPGLHPGIAGGGGCAVGGHDDGASSALWLLSTLAGLVVRRRKRAA